MSSSLSPGRSRRGAGDHVRRRARNHLALLGAAIAGLVVAFSARAGAQEAGEPEAAQKPSALVGRVLIEGTERPISDARVELLGQGRSVLTDSLGGFRLLGLAPGTDTLRVHFLDMEYQDVVVYLAPGRVLTVDLLTMYPMASMEEMVVRVPEGRAGRLEGFLRRRQAGFGQYLTREEIEASRAARLSQLLSRLPGIGVRGGEVLLLERGRTLALRPQPVLDTVIMVTRDDGTCKPAVFVDGARRAKGEVDDFPPGIVEAVEIYQSPFIPAPFADFLNRCGSILIWTRTGRIPT